MGKGYITIFLLLFFVFVPGMLFPQEKMGLPVIAVVTSEAGQAVNAIATVYEDGKQVQALGIGSGGRINLTFSFNHEYILVLSGDNCFPKRIAISTAIPKRVLETNYKFPPFTIEQSLFTEIKGIDKSFSDNSILRIYYDPGIDNFISQVYYNDAQVKKQIENAVWRSQQVGKTADELSKLTAEELRLMRQEYTQWIKEAGENYSNAKYQEAMMGYKAANRLFPAEQFPKDRIAEITDLLLALQITDNLDQIQEAKYKDLLEQAGQQFAQKNYEESKGLYRQVLTIKTNDQVAKARIAEIDRILKQVAADDEYKNIVAEADRLFKIGSLAAAKDKYNEALAKKPDDNYPKQQLKEIEKLVAAQEREGIHQQKYATSMVDGDGFRDKKQYLRARESYDFALTFKPSDPTAIARIAEVDGLMNKEKENKDYANSISEGDKSFAKKEYPAALASYQSAQKLKPGEAYPPSQIEKISSILNDEKNKQAAEQNYQAKIKEGDALFASANYQQAKESFSEALQLKPGEKYPAAKILEIDKLIAGIETKKQTDELYNSRITIADREFMARNYQSSKSAFSEAQALKPSEVYPKQKIAEINKILDQETLSRKEYENAVAQADKLYQNKNMEAAKIAFVNVKKIKPGEVYPDEMIAKIDEYLAEQSRLTAEQNAAEEARRIVQQRELDEKYNNLIKQADAEKSEKQYTAAVAAYKSALEVKPQEAYPTSQIDEINRLLAQAASLEKSYNDEITNADKAFRGKDYPKAKTGYTAALSLKPIEEYPKSQLAKIREMEDQLVKTEVLDNNYQASVAKGDELFGKQDYRLAIDEYTKALAYKPGEAYPKTKIAEANGKLTEIEKLKKDRETLDKNYSEALALADNSFNARDYDKAESGYRNALNIKPGEKYPSSRLDQIKQIRDDEVRKRYKGIIAEADALFTANEYAASRSKYTDAMNVIANDDYAKKRIAEIETLIEAQAKAAKEKGELDKKYSQVIAQADRAFKSALYTSAVDFYNQAMGFKPDEAYPKKKIEEIGEIIEAQKAGEEYKRLVLAADGFFRVKQYPEARKGYTDALAIKPQELYPANQIKTIDDLLARQQKLLADAAKKPVAVVEIETPASKNLPVGDNTISDMYDGFIKNGDQAFGEKEYHLARYYYYKALDAKPGEVYPNEKIAEIKKIIDARLTDSKEKEYLGNIDKADAALSEGELAIARAYYNRAGSAKPAEKYPKGQLELIRKKLDEMVGSKSIAEFKSMVAQGDSAFQGQDFIRARYFYLKAQDLNPSETYPKQQITKIRELIEAGTQ